MDQETADIAIPALADSEQRRLAAGRVLPWHRDQARCEITRPPELATVAYRGEQRRRSERSDTGNRHQASRAIIACGESLDLPRNRGDPLIHASDIFEELA